MLTADDTKLFSNDVGKRLMSYKKKIHDWKPHDLVPAVNKH